MAMYYPCIDCVFGTQAPYLESWSCICYPTPPPKSSTSVQCVGFQIIMELILQTEQMYTIKSVLNDFENKRSGGFAGIHLSKKRCIRKGKLLAYISQNQPFNFGLGTPPPFGPLLSVRLMKMKPYYCWFVKNSNNYFNTCPFIQSKLAD